MTSVNAVIGTGFGDEGKGLMTDYLARQNDNTIVVRSNGGAQAGHTVTLPNGTRHVFSHIGAGALAGKQTYLSEFFVSNPMLWKKELIAFNMLPPSVLVHPEGLITTPYDMVLNMAFEENRGDGVHGSVGIGFGETIERSETFYKLTVDDIYHKTRVELREILQEIRNTYVPSRLSFEPSERYQQILNDDDLIDNFITNCLEFRNGHFLRDYSSLEGLDLIVEGAQGLLLDQNHEYFPHVTRSNTGMKNVMSIVDQIGGIDPSDITVNYMSRAYTTRHGAGPLPYEMDLPYNIVDKTNINNDWQGSLRLAPLNLDVMFDAIQDDAQHYPDAVTRSVTFTCLDQLSTNALFIEGGTRYIGRKESLIKRLYDIADYVSYGPTHEDVTGTGRLE